MAGRRTSVYLTEDLAAAIGVLGAPLPDLLREAVAARTSPKIPAPTVSRARAVTPAADCPHRGLRPGAYCRGCNSIVPERKK